jgi:hypothetical protein
MANINTTLLENIRKHLRSYNCDERKLEHFLLSPQDFLDRQAEAIDVIRGAMTVHGKPELLPYVVELARVEYGIGELEPWVRDHVVHAVLSFVLGIYINERFLRLRAGIHVDRFQWKVAGLLHDVGYPLQIAKDISKAFEAKMNEIRRELGAASPDVRFQIVPIGLDILSNGPNSFELIQSRLDEWELRVDAREEYSSRIESGQICHGMISALAILQVIDLMYQKANPERKHEDIYYPENSNINWNQTYFEEDVVSACSAIYIHNLPTSCFSEARIDHRLAPVAFLLKLSDCLQQWERPSAEIKNGLLATQFGIEVGDDRLIFHANMPDEKREQILQELHSCLADPHVEILE